MTDKVQQEELKLEEQVKKVFETAVAKSEKRSLVVAIVLVAPVAPPQKGPLADGVAKAIARIVEVARESATAAVFAAVIATKEKPKEIMLTATATATASTTITITGDDVSSTGDNVTEALSVTRRLLSNAVKSTSKAVATTISPRSASPAGTGFVKKEPADKSPVVVMVTFGNPGDELWRSQLFTGKIPEVTALVVSIRKDDQTPPPTESLRERISTLRFPDASSFCKSLGIDVPSDPPPPTPPATTGSATPTKTPGQEQEQRVPPTAKPSSTAGEEPPMEPRPGPAPPATSAPVVPETRAAPAAETKADEVIAALREEVSQLQSRVTVLAAMLKQKTDELSVAQKALHDSQIAARMAAGLVPAAQSLSEMLGLFLSLGCAGQASGVSSAAPGTAPVTKHRGAAQHRPPAAEHTLVVVRDGMSAATVPRFEKVLCEAMQRLEPDQEAVRWKAVVTGTEEAREAVAAATKGGTVKVVVVVHFCATARTDGSHLAEVMDTADKAAGGKAAVRLVILRYGDDAAPMSIPDPRQEGFSERIPKSVEWFRDVPQVWLKTQAELSDKDPKLDALASRLLVTLR